MSPHFRRLRGCAQAKSVISATSSIVTTRHPAPAGGFAVPEIQVTHVFGLMGVAS